MTQNQHHYERVIDSQLPFAKAFATKWGDAPLSRVSLKLIETAPHRALALIALQSVWAQRGLDTADSLPFDVWSENTLSGEEIYQATTALAHAAGLDPNGLEGECVTQAMVAWQSARFRAAGRQTYVPSEGLTQRLLLTELRGITGSDLQMPYHTIYVTLPKSLGFQTFDRHTGWHDVTGCYVATDVHKGFRGLRLLLTAAGKTDELDDSLSHFFVPLIADQPIAATLTSVLENMRSQSHQARIDLNLPQDEAAMDRQADVWVNVFRWIMNLIFYTTSPVAELHAIEANATAARLWARIQTLPKKGNKKRAKLVIQHKQQVHQPRILLGKTIQVDRSMPTTATEKDALPRAQLTTRTLVSGHWQRFASGKGRIDRVWKYRNPFWRGPQDAPTSEKTTHELGADVEEGSQ